jgi:hypothetical protein
MTQHTADFSYIHQPTSFGLAQRLKSFVAIAIMLGMIFCAWRFGPAIRAQAKLIYWQHQCLTFDMDADWVAYEEDPAAAAKLAKLTGAEHKGGWNESDFFTMTGGASRDVVGCYLIPRCAIELKTRINPDASCGPVLFLHSRRAKNAGPERLVQVELSLVDRLKRRTPDQLTSGDDAILRLTVIRPSGIHNAPKILSTNGWWHEGISQTPFGKLEFYAGQADANDSSHFTLVYKDALAHREIDGWLQANDTVQLKVREILGVD